MKIEYMMLADNVQVQNGKIFVLGAGWWLWRSPNFPSQIQIGIGFVILFNHNEIGAKYALSLSIKDDASIAIVPELKAEIVAGHVPDAPKGSIQKVPVAINLNLLIPHPGRYKVEASIGLSHVETFFETIYMGNQTTVMLTPGSPKEQGN